MQREQGSVAELAICPAISAAKIPGISLRKNKKCNIIIDYIVNYAKGEDQ